MAAFSHCSFLLSSFSDHPLSSSEDTSLMPPIKLENPHDDVVFMNKKKKNKRENYTNGSSKQQEGTEGRIKKPRKSKNGSGNNGGVKKEEKAKITQEPPTGYIHVRARRGEATDSHSLAERVRREKISERMKMLQRLVPGCDKVTGKALVLDEIINYVHSLQNQVEFLSMKLASMNPTIFGDFTMGQDILMDTPDRLNTTSVASHLLPSVPQCSINNQVANFGDDYSATVLLQGGRSNDLFSSLDGVSELWDEAEDQRQNFPNPSSFNTNLWSFQC